MPELTDYLVVALTESHNEAPRRSYGLLRPDPSSTRWSAHLHACLRRDADGPGRISGVHL